MKRKALQSLVEKITDKKIVFLKAISSDVSVVLEHDNGRDRYEEALKWLMLLRTIVDGDTYMELKRLITLDERKQYSITVNAAKKYMRRDYGGY